MVTFLSGGTGTPKLLWGAGNVLSPAEISVVVNTGDDIELGGLHISPDIDTVMFERSGMLDRDTWWGIADDPTVTTDRARDLTRRVGLSEEPGYLDDDAQTSGRHLSRWRRFAGIPAFMTIGDRDRAHHMVRTRLLEAGHSLTDATRALCRAYEIDVDVLPMSDDPVATMIQTDDGWQHFQEYWVANRGDPPVRDVRYRGGETASTTPAVDRALGEPVIIGPANPITSLGPMLAVDRFAQGLADTPVVAVSPFVGDRAFSGPAPDLMRGTDNEPSTRGVADLLTMVDAFVLDEADDTVLDRPTIRTDTQIASVDDARRVTAACTDALAEVS